MTFSLTTLISLSADHLLVMTDGEAAGKFRILTVSALEIKSFCIQL